jgi:hypothetical protein
MLGWIAAECKGNAAHAGNFKKGSPIHLKMIPRCWTEWVNGIGFKTGILQPLPVNILHAVYVAVCESKKIFYVFE